MIRILAFAIFFLGCSIISLSENNQKLDSLEMALQSAKHDTIKLNCYLKILEECDFENNLIYTEPALKLVDILLAKNTNKVQRKRLLKRKIEVLDYIIPIYANKGLQEKRLMFDKMQLDIYTELKDTSNITNSLQTLSWIYKNIGNIPKALLYAQYGIIFFKKMNYPQGEAIFLNQLSNLYLEHGDTLLASNKLFEVLKINKMLKDTFGMATTYENIGFIYYDQKDSVQAFNNFKTSINLLTRIKKTKVHNYIAFSSIARMYSTMKDFKNSIWYAQKALEQSLVEDNGNGFCEILYLNGFLHAAAGDTIKSIYYYNKDIEERQKKGFNGLNFSQFHLARIYLNKRKYQLARNHAYAYLERSKKIGSVEYSSDGELLCSQVDSAMGNYKDAFTHFKNYINLSNKLKSEEVSKSAIREKFQSEFEKQKAIAKASQDKKDAHAKLELIKQKNILNLVIIGLIFTLLFSLFIYRSLNIRKKQNKLIESQKKSIETSYKNLELLNNIGTEITASLNLDSVMELIYKNVSALMDVSFFIISTYDVVEDAVDVKFCVKENIVVPINFKTYLSNPKSIMTALTVHNKKTIIIQDWEKEYSNYQAEASQLKDKNDLYCDSMIWIPLLIKNEVIGLFSVQSINKNAYSTENINILNSLSNIISVALNNAETYRNIESAKSEITSQKNIVEEKQKEILDSIEYALRIQTAILPPQKIVKQHLENSFILYKPKDIVAGDFYWMETVRLDDGLISVLANEKNVKVSDKQMSELANESELINNQLINSLANQLILFAACDCTGHGVPGAMVSVVCHNALNRAVHEFGLTEPAAILDKTAEIVVENFSKSEEEIKDGMDISLCAYNPSTNQLKWAGANNPLWLFRNGEFVETKADKQPIGMNEDHHPFTNHSFNLQQGDTIYIFSDGFADQFSPADKKLMKKNFKNILLSIQNKTMQEQHEYLNNFIENWKGNMEQTDDILVIGVKI